MLRLPIIYRVVCSLILSLPCLLGGRGLAAIHDIPDNFAERTLAIVVRDRTAFITYRAGLNVKTMRNLLQKWNLPDDQYSETLSESKLSENFRQAAFGQLASGLKISIDGKPLTVEKISCEPSSRHHFSLIANYKIGLGTSSKPIDLEVTDNNFPDQQGAIRCSLKAMGKAMVLRSNAAPIIVRAKRHELEKLTPIQRKEASSIKVKLGFSPD